MDKHKLAFETAMTQAATIAMKNMTEANYNLFQAQFAKAWAQYDQAIDEAVRDVQVQNKTTDKRWSLSVTLGLRKEG